MLQADESLERLLDTSQWTRLSIELLTVKWKWASKSLPICSVRAIPTPIICKLASVKSLKSLTYEVTVYHHPGQPFHLYSTLSGYLLPSLPSLGGTPYLRTYRWNSDYMDRSVIDSVDSVPSIPLSLLSRSKNVLHVLPLRSLTIPYHCPRKEAGFVLHTIIERLGPPACRSSCKYIQSPYSLFDSSPPHLALISHSYTFLFLTTLRITYCLILNFCSCAISCVDAVRLITVSDNIVVTLSSASSAWGPEDLLAPIGPPRPRYPTPFSLFESRNLTSLSLA